MVDKEEKLRADARANRDRLLDVAREALAADPESSLNSIAKAAGVGAGTLYRHFPTREALVLGVYRNEIDALVALAPSLLARHSPLQSLRVWCDRLAKFGSLKHGLADIIHATDADQDLQRTYVPLLGAVRELMTACADAGEIRPGTDPEDLLVLMGLLWRIPPTTAGTARVKRIVALALRGLGVKVP